MRKVTLFFTLTMFLFLTGCVPSLQPLYTEEDLSFDPALIGTWVVENSDDTWEFIKEGETEYKLVVKDSDAKMYRGGKGEFQVHLLKVDGVVFLDLFPAEPKCLYNDFYMSHLFPVHTFMRVFQVEPTLKFAHFSTSYGLENKGWLEKYLEENPTAIRHEQVEDRILLTAPPRELQKFLVTHLNEGFNDPLEMKRQQQEKEAGGE